MPLSLIVDSLEELPEALRGRAKESGGKFVVSELGEFAIENVRGLKQALSEEKAGRKAAEKMVAAFEGLTADDVPDARRALDAMRAGSLKSTKDIDDYKRALDDKYGTERKKLEERLAKRDQQLRANLVDQEATKHLVKAGGGNALRVLLPLVRAAARVEEDSTTGEMRVSLHDEQGRPLISKKQGNNDPMGFEEFIAQLRDAADLKPLFVAQHSGGSGGTSQSGGSARPGEPIDITKMSPADLMARGNRTKATA